MIEVIKQSIRQGFYVGTAMGCLFTWIASELSTPRAFELAIGCIVASTILSLIDRG